MNQRVTELRAELVKLLRDVDVQFDMANELATEMGITRERLRNNDGSFFISELLNTKATILASLVEIETMTQERRIK